MSSGFGRAGRGKDLTCDGVSLRAVADATGTPTYVYSAAAVREAYTCLDRAFTGCPDALHPALKANSNLALVRLIQSLGSQVDANSAGELDVALRAGFQPADVVFTGVGKTPDEIDRIVALGVKAINVESTGELERIARTAADRGMTAAVALRVNPDIDSGTHPHITTGRRENKFGVPLEAVPAIGRDLAEWPALRLVGIHVHLGSQIVDLEPFRRAAETAVELARALRADERDIEYVDLGGGLGISYDGSAVPGPDAYAAAVRELFADSGFEIVLEPGRFIVGPAGALLATVVDVKRFAGGRRFVVLDAGMSELIRPALYDAFHRIEAVEIRAGDAEPCDVVGPVCESSDVFARDRPLTPVEPGDRVALLDAGAYGAAMASNYLRRPLPAEVLVDQGAWRVIRRRQTLEDLLALESG